MSRGSQLVEKLERVFTSDQAIILSEVIQTEYDQLVKVSDFNELKGVVKDLAVAVEDLAQAQNRTETRVEEMADELKDLAQAQNRTERSLQNLAKQVGGLSEAFGGSLEDFAIDIVPDILEHHWGIKITSSDREEIKVGDIEIEFDLVIRGKINNNPIMVLGEVKSNLTVSEVVSFLKIVEKVRNIEKTAEVRALFFGYRVKNDAKKLIIDRNASMIFTHGKIIGGPLQGLD